MKMQPQGPLRSVSISQNVEAKGEKKGERRSKGEEKRGGGVGILNLFFHFFLFLLFNYFKRKLIAFTRLFKCDTTRYN